MADAELMENPARSEILVFGDSVMKGVTLDKPEERYKLIAAAARKKLEDDLRIRLLIRSHFGQTISRGAELVKKVIDRNPHCKTVVLEFGGNDCDYDWEAVSLNPQSEHQPRTLPEQFLHKYRDLIEYLKERSTVPVLMNLPPIDPQRYLDFICRDGLSGEQILSFVGDVGRIYRFQEFYSNMVDKLAASTDSCLIDVRQAYLKHRDFRELICIDGIHPNRAGHDLLYDVIRAFIEDHLASPGFITA